MTIPLKSEDRIFLLGPTDLPDHAIRILMRETCINRDKKHLWIISMNLQSMILYIELVSMGSYKATVVEPLNVYRVAVLKGATNVVAVHNHPSGSMVISGQDKMRPTV